MRIEFTARTVIFCLGVAFLAAFSYAVISHLWVRAAHRNTGPLLFSDPSFMVLKVAAIFTLAVSAVVTARRAGTHWALAATGTGHSRNAHGARVLLARRESVLAGAVARVPNASNSRYRIPRGVSLVFFGLMLRCLYGAQVEG